jgi:glycerophosphoryl diester phosphodiesterase
MQAPRLPESLRRLPVAHRAYHDRSQRRPENSRAAIRAAIAAGYAIEIDLQLSADGHAMVFHDDTLDRLTAATGPVRARPAAELAGIALKDAEEGIPSFAEVLALVNGAVPLLVEIKDQDGAVGPGVGLLEAAAARCLAGYRGDVAVMSFNPHSMAEMARLLPRVPRGLTTWEWTPEEWPPLDEAACARLRAIPDYHRVGASFISHHWQDLGRARVAELAAQGADVLCWTIRSPQAEAEARRIACNVTFEGYAAAIPAG